MMHKKLLIPCAGVVALVVFAGIAFGGVPCLGTSSIAASINGGGACGTIKGAVCPGNDFRTITVTVTVKDCYGTPLGPGLAVQVDPVSTVGFIFEEPTTKNVATNALGVATATYRDIGGYGNIQFQAIVQALTLGPTTAIYCSGVDNNKTGDVGLLDFSNFTGDYNGSNPRSDYNCDGTVGLLDFSDFSAHYNHT